MSERFVRSTADRTCSASVDRIYEDYSFSNVFSLVLDKILELSERPSSEFLVEFPTEFLGLSDFQFLEGECVIGHCDNRFADAMVCVSHEAGFSSANFSKFSFCRASAFGLQFFSEKLISGFNVSDMFGIEENVIGTHSNIIDTNIYTKNFIIGRVDNYIFFSNKIQKKSTVFISDKLSRFDSPINISFIASRNADFEFLPTINSTDTNNSFFEFRSKGSYIESDSAKLFFNWFNFHFLPLKHVGSLISGTLNKAALELWIIMSYGFVSKLVENIFIEGNKFESRIYNSLAYFIVDNHSLIQGFIVTNQNFNSSFHNTSLEINLFEGIGYRYSMRETKYSSAITNINYHFVWCPKYRKPALEGKLQERIGHILRTICASRGWVVHELRVNTDHIHLFVSTPPYDSPTGIVKILKGILAQELFRQMPELRKIFRKGHIWSPSYYVGTAGNVSSSVIERYIREQKSVLRSMPLNSSSQQVERSP